MAAPSGTYLTTSTIGIREDLADVIYRISPTQTPTLSSASKAKATQTLHEWQTQDLAAASASNEQLEGDDATNKTVTPTVRLSNRTQISTKTVQVAGTNQSVIAAGRKGELGYQVSMAMLELKRDMESSLTQNSVTATSPRRSRGLRGWIADNVNHNGSTLADYVANTGYTNGTQRAFTEAQLKDVLQKQYTAGGEPDMLMMGAAQKQTFSGFTGNSTRFDKGEDKTVTASVDVYVSDFGELKAVPNRFQLARDVFSLQTDKLAVAYLRPFSVEQLAKTGDSERRMIVVEYTLECRAPKAHGAIYDVQN